jgi:hypothetical protein
MATELMPVEHTVGGQPTVSGYVVTNAVYGVEEDTETKQAPDGGFLSKITYSRRPTLRLEMEAESGTTPAYSDGGTIASGSITDGNGDAMGWKIRSATVTNTRGPIAVSLDLIGLTDYLT